MKRQVGCEVPSGETRPGNRTVRNVRFAAAVAALGAFGLAYLFSAGVRQETDRAFGMLARGDIAALRDYILSFGVWAPVVSTLLMVLQAVAAPCRPSLSPSPTGSRSAPFGAGF